MIDLKKLLDILVIVMGISLATFAVAKDPYTYEALLAKKCPQKHLEFMSPSELASQIDIFENGQSPSIQDKMDKTANVETSCANIEAGASCRNFSYVRAIGELNLTSRFAKQLCKVKFTCTSFDDCR